MTNLKQYLEKLEAEVARDPKTWPGVNLKNQALANETPKLLAALEETVGALEVCDLALKAAKPCVTGGHDMNENIAADALSRVNTLIGEAK